MSKGLQVNPALEAVGIASRSTYENWRRTDADFKALADHHLALQRGKSEDRKPVPDFETFAREYLHEPLFWHQQQWFDLLEGREPRDLHPAQTYQPGRLDRLLCNTPPEHGKSTTITMNYITWRIVNDPNIRIILVSKTQRMAETFVYGIKSRLTGPRYRKLQQEFGPPETYEGSADSWTARSITLGQKDDGQKDPTLQALGMGGQIYGARADLIVLDDCVTLDNAHDYEKQTLWLTQEVVTRLSKGGKVLVVGTRVSPNDLYRYLRDTYPGVYTYFAQPAVLEFAPDPGDWKTLWPMTVIDGEPEEKWDGPALSDRRAEVTAGTWQMAYMQADVSVDAIFPEKAVLAAINGQRTAGLLRPGQVGHRENGMEGLYVLCTMDPALTGACAAIAYAVDRNTGKRWILDAHNERGMTPQTIRELIMVWTDRYKPSEWRIEKNAMQGMLTQDAPLRDYLAGRGCRLVEHFTGNNKWDDSYGVASMAALFLPAIEDPPRPTLVDFPATKFNQPAANAVKEMVGQLVAWQPREKTIGKKAQPGSTDLVMALWFAEIRARELCRELATRPTHMTNRYASRASRAGRTVVNVQDALAAKSLPEAFLA